jgi:cytochrome P450
MKTRIAKKLASERYATKNVDHQDMLSSFISHGLTESDLITESVMQILAGAETTATALRATLLHTITNTRIYSTLQTEIDKAVKTEKISSPVIKDTEWRHLVYLQAVIKEGLRFWPPVTGLMTKFSPPSGDEFEVDGEKVFIPGGTNIGWASNGIHRNRAAFGEDVNLFRPERWLEDGDGDGERLEKMRRVVDLNFGYGKYYCLGRLIALSELHKTIFEVGGEEERMGLSDLEMGANEECSYSEISIWRS